MITLYEQLRTYLEEEMRLLEESVNLDSPSNDKTLSDRMATWYASQLARIAGASVERISHPDRGDLLLGKVGQGTKHILLLGHYDTVWPEGEARRRPFRKEGNRAYGPGVYDMKAGLLMGMYALRALKELNRFPQNTKVFFFINSEEEVGSPYARRWIETLGRQSDAVLVLEPPLERDGALKTWRKGSARYCLTVHGRAAHAGVEPKAGVSAIRELAYQIEKIYELADEEKGTTVNVGIVRGGVGVNVVAPQAEAHIDVRMKTRAEANRIDQALSSLAPRDPGTTLNLQKGVSRPPMERSRQTAALFRLAQRAAAEEIGEVLKEGGTGGVSDANFCAPLGIPTLDGLGARGANAHSYEEFIWIDELPKRAAILAGLIERI